jgi:hypothetical protein
MGIGEYLGDAIRDIAGYAGVTLLDAPSKAFSGTLGTGWAMGSNPFYYTSFHASRVVPTALEFRPASTSAYFCIKY